MNEEIYRISEDSAYEDLDIDDFTNEDDRETIMEELYEHPTRVSSILLSTRRNDADRNHSVSRMPEER